MGGCRCYSYFYNTSTELIIHLWIAKRSANAATVFSPPDKLSIGRNLEVDKIYIKAYKQSVDYLQHLIPHV